MLGYSTNPIMATEPLTLEPTQTSIAWIDSPDSIDKSFIEDVPIIPAMTSQAIFESMISSATDKLFDKEPPAPWALFFPFKGYFHQIKRLFRRKVLSSFETDLAIEVMDNLNENGIPTDTEDAEKIYEMLYTLENLNELLETIYLKIFSTLKP